MPPPLAGCHACVSTAGFIIRYGPQRAAAPRLCDGTAACARFSMTESAVCLFAGLSVRSCRGVSALSVNLLLFCTV